MNKLSIIAITGLILICTSTGWAALVGYWSFDDPTDPGRDNSGNGNDGTVYGATWITPGKIGGALSFDGMDDYVSVPDDDSLDLSDGMTITAWIRSDSTLGPRVIVSKWNDSTLDWSYIFKDHNISDKLRIELSRRQGWHNDLADLEGATSISLGNWIHVATTFDSDTVRLYFNGIEDGSQSSIGTINSSITDLLIGAVFTLSPGGIWENFDGLIDEVRIYNRALSDSEIKALVPEPATLLLLGLGALGFRIRRQ